MMIVLHWPTSCLPLNNPNINHRGFVVGWDDETPSNPKPTKTIACAGIISHRKNVNVNDNESQQPPTTDDSMTKTTDPSSDNLLEQLLFDIDRAIRNLREQDETACNLSNDGRESNDYEVLLKGVKVVAIWDANITDERLNQYASSKILMKLPVIALKSVKLKPDQNLDGILYDDDNLHVTKTNASDISKSQVMIPTLKMPARPKISMHTKSIARTMSCPFYTPNQYLTLYQPCSLHSLDYYQHSPDTSYHSLFASDTTLSNASTSPFSLLLMRFSEAETIMDHLKSFYEQSMNIKLSSCESKSNQQHPVNNHDIQNNVDVLNKKHHCRRPEKNNLRRNLLVSSLVSLHFKKNQVKCVGFNGNRIEALAANIPLIHAHYMITSNRCNQHSTYQLRKTRRELSNQQLYHDRLKYDAITDSVLGILVGMVIMNQQDTILELIKQLWNVVHGKLLRNNIGWLETFPAGFKLNVPLTKVLGKATLWFTENHENFLQRIVCSVPSITETATTQSSINWPKVMIKVLGIFCIIFGFQFSCAIIFDIIRLITIHIQIMSRIFQNIYQMELSLFSSLWSLFQGKKKNILRKRSDTLHFDFMQLLLGMIVFTISLFLFTTILVYYAFFTFVHLAVTSIAIGVWSWYCIWDKMPMGDILTSAMNPGRFCTEVHFQEMERDIDSSSEAATIPTDIFKMVANTMSPSSVIVQALSRPLKEFVKNAPRFIVEVLNGQPTTIIQCCIRMVSQQHCPRSAEVIIHQC